MSIRSLSAFLAIALATGCASTSRMSVPKWPRYQDGELAGFLHAPGEQVVRNAPHVMVRRAKGRITAPAAELPLQYLPQIPGATDSVGYRPPDFGVVDTTMFVVELRGPGATAHVRTIATRSGTFDFGPLPDGSYELKATSSGSAFALGWRSEVRTVIVSGSADVGTEIIVP